MEKLTLQSLWKVPAYFVYDFVTAEKGAAREAKTRFAPKTRLRLAYLDYRYRFKDPRGEKGNPARWFEAMKLRQTLVKK